jgi:outer membrane lipoprotein LolB
MALALGLAVAGCATPPQDASLPATAGRLSLRVDAAGDRPAQSLVAGFELRGSGERGELKLLSPIGTQLAQARWLPGSARLVAPDGTREFASLDALSREVFGEPLPLAALPDWLRARPWPAAAAVATAQGFDQLGWAVDTTRAGDGAIQARRAAPPAVTLRVQLDRGD